MKNLSFRHFLLRQLRLYWVLQSISLTMSRIMIIITIQWIFSSSSSTFDVFWSTSKKFTIESIDERMTYIYIAMKMIIYLKIARTSSKVNCVSSTLPLRHRQLFLLRFRKFSIRKTFNFRTTSRSRIEEKKIDIVCFISYALWSRN